MNETFQKIKDWMKTSQKEIEILPVDAKAYFAYIEDFLTDNFAPDCLEIEDLELTMGQFLTWCFHGDTDRFYVDYRWHDWKKEVAGLHYDNGIAFYPFLFAEANDLESRMRKEVPMAEIVGIAFEMLKYT